MRARLTLLAVFCALAPRAVHADDAPPKKIHLLPGASRAISHAMSASRDTALLGLALTPYSVLTAGGDVGIVEFDLSSVALRVGFFGMIELESDRPYSGSPPDFIPRENSAYWRAHGGYSLALDLERFAQRHLGPRGAVELTLSLRHESEHFTGDPSGDTPRFEDYPHIGNFVMGDVAVRLTVGVLEVELRLQGKVFIGEGSYVGGPGADAIVRWRASEWVHPFSSTFAEFIAGADGVPDNYLVRNLTGLLLRGRFGDIQVFNSIEVGHGKGLNVFNKELRWVGGIRLAFF